MDFDDDQIYRKHHEIAVQTEDGTLNMLMQYMRRNGVSCRSAHTKTSSRAGRCEAEGGFIGELQCGADIVGGTVPHKLD